MISRTRTLLSCAAVASHASLNGMTISIQRLSAMPQEMILREMPICHR